MKNKILKGITYIAVIVFIISGIALDGNIKPYISCSVALAWLGLFAYANRDRFVWD